MRLERKGVTQAMSASEISGGLVDAALEISAKRRETLARMRDAFQRGDREEALALAEKLCGVRGVDDEQKSHRTDQSVN